LNDYHNWMKRAAPRSSAINTFDAINRCQFFGARCNQHEKNKRENPAPNLWRQFREHVSGTLGQYQITLLGDRGT